MSARFDRIFGCKTGFATLDRLLTRLRANKAELLRVLERPEIPLNTNGSENDIRCQVTKRKIGGGTRSDRQILRSVSQFEKAMLFAKLRGARERKNAQTGKCGGRKSYAERDPKAVLLAKKLARYPVGAQSRRRPQSR